MGNWIMTVGGGGAALAAATLWRRWRAARKSERQRLAIGDFLARRETVTDAFLPAAASLGKPRGLAWQSCDFHDAVEFALDRATGELYALAGVTIAFSAVEGGGMEDVEAVSNLRCATAVFVHRDGAWISEGRTVFNLEPAEAVLQFRETLERLPSGAELATAPPA